MIDQIEIHERLATLEAGQLFTNQTLKEVKGILEKHQSAACDGSCEVGKDVLACQTSLKTYKRLTWVGLVAIMAAGLKSLFPA
jgi:hypothetical protein